MAAFPKYSAINVTTATGRVLKATPGSLGGISVNKATVGTVTVTDGSTTIAVLASSTPGGMYLQGPIAFSSLSTSMTTAAENVTFIID
jgi:hypothetical protein